MNLHRHRRQRLGWVAKRYHAQMVWQAMQAVIAVVLAYRNGAWDDGFAYVDLRLGHGWD